MAATNDRSETGELYDRDFVLWTEAQAAALRGAGESNLPLDWQNLAEEIESLGKSDRRELRSQIRRILRHLLKLKFSPAEEPRAGWRAAISEARNEIDGLLEDSPSLRREIDDLIGKQLPAAVRLAEADLSLYREQVPFDPSGFAAEQVLGDWFPEDPQG
jgi:Domain of unknown function DUF29